MERSCEPMDKNRIEGAVKQGERAMNREALVIGNDISAVATLTRKEAEQFSKLSDVRDEGFQASRFIVELSDFLKEDANCGVRHVVL